MMPKLPKKGQIDFIADKTWNKKGRVGFISILIMANSGYLMANRRTKKMDRTLIFNFYVSSLVLVLTVTLHVFGVLTHSAH